MSWLPAGYNATFVNQSAVPTLLYFLVHYFGASNDDILKDVYAGQELDATDYDFVIVGAGTAGCVVANRLSEESKWKVLLLEAGDEEPLAAEVPWLWTSLTGSSIDYGYRISNTTSSTYARGKVMGGSSTIHAMVYSRGAKADYDEWASNGNEGWSWEEVLPYFKKSEQARDPEILANYSQFHGTSGELIVEQFPTEDKFVPTFIDAFKEAGLQETDYNKGDQIGVSRIQFTSIHGTRLSSNGAFIRPIRGKRSNLFVKPNCRVTRIMIDGTTKRATGVEYESTNENGEIVKKTANAAKEVIISAGVIDSPKLLMLSGIGPKSDLEKLNITVIKDLPVGQNFHDHYRVSLPLISSFNVSATNETTRKSQLLEWLNTHEGPVSTRGGISVIAFIQSKFENRSGAADLQYGLTGVGAQADGTIGNVSIFMNLVRSDSQGSVELNTSDPLNNQPDIRIDLLGDPQDIEVFVEGLKFAIKVANTSALRGLGLKISASSGCKNYDLYSDDYWRCFVKNSAARNSHGSGTCKMGPASDNTAVVDPELKVHGVEGLRVIDASIMPRVVRSNTGAPTIMIGEKGSDMIKKDYF